MSLPYIIVVKSAVYTLMRNMTGMTKISSYTQNAIILLLKCATALY